MNSGTGTAAMSQGNPIKKAPLRAIGMTAVFIVVVALVLFLYRDTGALLNHFDDAYITYRYAIHLARGDGLVFNIGERTDAASSFLYTLILSSLYRIGLHDLERMALVIGVGSAGGIAVAVYSGALHLSRRWPLAAALGVAAGAHGLVSGWAVSGMETTFYALLVVLFFERCFVRSREDHWSVLLLVLIVLARIEGVLVAGAWALGRAEPVLFGVGVDAPAARRRTLEHGAVVTGAILSFFLFKLAYYGTLLPHTFHLKQLVLLYRANPEALWTTWRGAALGILVLGVAGAASLPRPSNRVGVAAFLLLCGASCATGPWADFARYSVYLLPPLVLLSAVPLGLLFDSQRLRVTGALLLCLVGFDVSQSCQWMRDFLSSFADHQRCRKAVGDYLATSFDSARPVMSSDIGAISYRAMDFSFVDLFGLTSNDVLKRYQEGKNADDVLQERRPSVAADTWRLLDGRWVYSAEALLLWPEMILLNKIEPSELARHFHHEAPAFTCVAKDGFFFAVGPLPPP